MVITRMSRGIKNPQKIAIYIDSKYTFSVLENVVVDKKLFIGKEVSKSEIDEIRSFTQFLELRNRVLNLISRRPHSEKEVYDYLIKKTSEDNTKLIIEKLVEDKYINDYDFANWWVEQRTAFTNKSSRLIRQELIIKGIDREIIDEAILQIDDNQDLKSANKLFERKLNSLNKRETDTKIIKVKLTRYLISKGFSWDTIRSLLNDNNF